MCFNFITSKVQRHFIYFHVHYTTKCFISMRNIDECNIESYSSVVAC